MNHDLAETWLLSGEQLTPVERAELEAHLGLCASCRRVDAGLRSADAALRGAPPARPAAGFLDRWLVRQAGEVAFRRESEGWRALAFLMASAAALSLLIVVWLLRTDLWISVLTAVFLEAVVRWALLLRVLSELGRTIVIEVPAAAISAYLLWMLSLVAATGAVGLAWASLFRRLSPRGVEP